jgi:hypothetical protein
MPARGDHGANGRLASGCECLEEPAACKRHGELPYVTGTNES